MTNSERQAKERTRLERARRAIGKIYPPDLIGSMSNKRASAVLHNLERAYRCLTDLQSLTSGAAQ